jgi:hypothetical protein
MRFARLVIVGALLALSCTSAQSPPSPDVGYESRVFGRAPNVTGVFRVRDSLRDPLYGPYTRRAFDKSGAAASSLMGVVESADEIDGACDVRPDVRSQNIACTIVVYGGDLPDPSAIRFDAAAAFESKARLASGAVEWSVHDASDWSLFTAHGAWVFAHGEAIDPMRKSLSDDPSPPPRIDLERGALAAVTIRGSAFSSHDYNRSSFSGTEGIVVDALDTGEMVITSSARGDVVTRFWLTKVDTAKILEGEILASLQPGDRCDAECKLLRAMLSGAIDVTRDGSFVSIRVHFPEAILRKLL